MERLRTVGVKVRASVEVLAVERDAITIRERLTGDELRLTGFTAVLRASRGRSNHDFLTHSEPRASLFMRLATRSHHVRCSRRYSRAIH